MSVQDPPLDQVIARVFEEEPAAPRGHPHQQLKSEPQAGGVWAMQGMCDARFREVGDEFERNFAERGEVGASVCVIDRRAHRRRSVGRRRRSTHAPAVGERHHRSGMVVHQGSDGPVRPPADFARLARSRSAGGVVLAGVRASGQGRHHRPHAAQSSGGAAGHSSTAGSRRTVRLAIHDGRCSHPRRRSGSRARDRAIMPRRSAISSAKLVRRVSGRPFDVFFREEVAGPLGLDFHIGLPEEHEPRVRRPSAPIRRRRGEPRSRFLTRMATDPASIQALTVKNSGRRTAAGDHDSREAHRAVLPSQGGITNARGLAGMYAPLAMGGGSLVDGDTLKQHERRQFGDRRRCDAADRLADRPGVLEIVGQSPGTAGGTGQHPSLGGCVRSSGHGRLARFCRSRSENVVWLYHEQAGTRRLC